MKELENLKELYLEEIKRINKKGELTPADSEAAKCALEAIEKIDGICERYEEEEGYSERYSTRGRSRAYMMPDVDPMYSERRGRSATTGRYVSRNSGAVDHMIQKLEHMKMDAPDRETEIAIDKVIDKLEAY